MAHSYATISNIYGAVLKRANVQEMSALICHAMEVWFEVSLLQRFFFNIYELASKIIVTTIHIRYKATNRASSRSIHLNIIFTDGCFAIIVIVYDRMYKPHGACDIG